MNFQTADILGITSTELNRYKSIEKENQRLKSQLALCVEALDYIRKISYNEGFKIYRNDKDLVKTTLDKLAAMQSEGEK